MKATPDEKRVVRQKDLKDLEKKIKSQDKKEDAKLYQRKRKK